MKTGLKKEFIFLAFASVGIILLLFLACFMNSAKISIKDINKAKEGQQITIIGKIDSYRFFENSSFEIINIKDETGNITGTLNSKQKIEFNKTKEYIFEGRISLYENQTQISIDKIKLVN
jgi:RecG-like helicase